MHGLCNVKPKLRMRKCVVCAGPGPLLAPVLRRHLCACKFVYSFGDHSPLFATVKGFVVLNIDSRCYVWQHFLQHAAYILPLFCLMI